MTRRRSMTPLRRARIFEAAGGVCHICRLRIAVGEPWEAEHIVALEISGDDSDANIAPAHVACHRAKTAEDAGRIAKARRVHAKHIGAYRAKATLPGSRASKWKRRVDGTVVRRDSE
jgi:5-methylcytosine-specific restriction endonuclease McrA